MYWTTENEDGVVYEDDSKDDKDYVWADHFEPTEEGSFGETEANNVGDEESPISDDYVYNNLPDDMHVLKIVVDCKKCGAKRFQYETKGFYCHDG
jgi:hypothetical protein